MIDLELIKENWLFFCIYSVALLLVWGLLKWVVRKSFGVVFSGTKKAAKVVVTPFMIFKQIKVILITLIILIVILTGFNVYLLYFQ